MDYQQGVEKVDEPENLNIEPLSLAKIKSDRQVCNDPQAAASAVILKSLMKSGFVGSHNRNVSRSSFRPIQKHLKVSLGHFIYLAKRINEEHDLPEWFDFLSHNYTDEIRGLDYNSLEQGVAMLKQEWPV